MKICKIKNCDRKHNSSGYCLTHWRRIQNTGSPYKTLISRRGYWFTKKGYVQVRYNGKTVFQHRLIMERHLCRPLEKFEQIHHINGIKHDNRIENLKIVTSLEHAQEHPERYIKETKFNKFPCLICGLLSKARGLCSKHYSAWYQELSTFPKNKKPRPSRKQY